MQRHHWIAVALVLTTLVAYEPLRQNDFVRFDDGGYITYNPHVLAGLSGDGLAWAFNVGSNGNWHPLTWLSHMLDVSLWGLDPRGHHLTNLALHASSAVLLFLLFRRMTGHEGRSAFVAAVFAIHPLHVESVAWAAERKDVLSTLLGFLSLWFWVDWTNGAGRGRYLASLSFFALSLTAKPMLVSLPFLLLLLDFWPLTRSRATGGVLREKVPFFALALLSCAMTVVAQKSGKALTGVSDLPLSFRFTNAVSAYVSYLGKAFWPTNLAVFYPYPYGGVPVAKVVVGVLLLVAATLAALRFARRLPWLAVGWWWWLGTLVPVIGIVQVGKQSMADRYTYVPLVGLSIVIAWGTAELLSRWRMGRMGRTVAAALGIAAVCMWIGLTRAQVKLWRNDYTLFEHAAAVTERSYLAHFRLGYALVEQHRYDEAIAHYALAVQYDPEQADAHNDYGVALLALGRSDQAAEQFSQAIRRAPGGDVYINLARAQLAQRRLPEGIASLREGLRLRPERQDARILLEQALREQAQPTPAPVSK